MTDQQQKDADPDLVAVSADLNRAGDTPVVALGIIEQIRGGADLRLNWTDLRTLIHALNQRQQTIVGGIEEKFNFSFFRGRVLANLRRSACGQFAVVRHHEFDPAPYFNHERVFLAKFPPQHAIGGRETLDPSATDVVLFLYASAFCEKPVCLVANEF